MNIFKIVVMEQDNLIQKWIWISTKMLTIPESVSEPVTSQNQKLEMS